MPASPQLITRLAFLLGLAASSAPADSLVLLEGPTPGFPNALLNSSITTGASFIACTIDDDGTILDSWPVQATHPAFATVGQESLLTWRYAAAPASPPPAAWPRFEIVRFDFNRGSSIVSFNTYESHRPNANPETPSAFRLEELPMLPAGSLAPVHHPLPTPAKGSPAGEVQVEFLIDRTGQARVPVAVYATHPSLARASVAAVRTWRFAALPDSVSAPAARYRWSFRFGAKPTTP